MAKSEQDIRLDELAEKLSGEYMLKCYKVEVFKKIREGVTGLASEIDRIARLEKTLQENPESPEAKKEIEDSLNEISYGIPEKLKVKRPYTLSPEALRARQQNAQKSTGPRTEEGKARSAQNGKAGGWKHGLYSKSIVRKTFGLCNKQCEKYPCQAVENDETEKGELCLDHDGLPAKIKVLVDAAQNGDIKGVKEINAVLLAMFTEQLERMLLNVHWDGALVKEEMFDKYGTLLGHKLKNHPNIGPIIDGMAKLGITFEDMRLTPKELQRTRDADKDRKTLAEALSAAGRNLATAFREDDGDGS